MDVKQLFENSPGFGDVCFEKYGRYPSIETLERKDVRPGNVRNLPVDSGVNPITHDFRINYTEWRTHMISIDTKFETSTNRWSPISDVHHLRGCKKWYRKNSNIFFLLF